MIVELIEGAGAEKGRAGWRFSSIVDCMAQLGAGAVMRERRDIRVLLAAVVGPVFLLEVGWFVVDHLLPDLVLNKFPEPLRWSVAKAGVLLCVSAGAWWASKVALRHWPRPWFPRPFWRVVDWMKQRARLAIVTASIEVINGLLVLEGAKASVTLSRDLSRARRPSRILFDSAQIILKQKRGERTISWVLVPEEAGGFLAEPIQAGRRDAVLIVFRGTGFPMRQSELIDVARAFSIELIGVVATIGDLKPVTGRLPSVSWIWSGAYTAAPNEVGAERSF